MKRFVLAAAAAACVAVAANAADPFEATYGNTVTMTFANGMKTITYVNADKTWEQRIGDAVMKGTYAWKDATHACFTVTEPKPADPAEATSCNDYAKTHKVGDSWTEQTPNGPITVSITAGR
jgi:opacity protein-like surface antigen